MTALAVLVLMTLAVAGVLLLVLHHPRQETTMTESEIANLESIDASCVIEPEPALPRRFVLHRDVDVSGISGTGIVAEGVAFTDGTAVIHWIAGEHRSTVVWSSVESVEAIHGHGGATKIVWFDVACRGWWVEPDLCSACSSKGGR